jgi:hypothetical protein
MTNLSNTHKDKIGYEIGDRLAWTIIRDTLCYVLHHERGNIRIVEIGDKFIIGEEFNRDEDYWERYHAIPKSRVISVHAFKCFQEDREDVQSQLADMFDKILGRKK